MQQRWPRALLRLPHGLRPPRLVATLEHHRALAELNRGAPCVAKAKVLPGYCSASAAALRALVEGRGAEIPLAWDESEVRAVARVHGAEGVVLTRARLRSWEGQGWARLVPEGDRNAVLRLDILTLPEELGSRA